MGSFELGGRRCRGGWPRAVWTRRRRCERPQLSKGQGVNAPRRRCQHPQRPVHCCCCCARHHASRLGQMCALALLGGWPHSLTWHRSRSRTSAGAWCGAVLPGSATVHRLCDSCSLSGISSGVMIRTLRGFFACLHVHEASGFPAGLAVHACRALLPCFSVGFLNNYTRRPLPP